MDTFGDPLSGFDLRKPIIVLYPAYFVLRRILFVLVSLYLWKRPLTQISIRMLNAGIGFVLLSVVRPYPSPKTTFMELMNEATTILLLDCLIVFTEILNKGNVNDLNGGNTPNLENSR